MFTEPLFLLSTSLKDGLQAQALTRVPLRRWFHFVLLTYWFKFRYWSVAYKSNGRGYFYRRKRWIFDLVLLGPYEIIIHGSIWWCSRLIVCFDSIRNSCYYWTNDIYLTGLRMGWASPSPAQPSPWAEIFWRKNHGMGWTDTFFRWAPMG